MLSLFVADITGAAPPAAAAGGGVIDLTGSVPATFAVTPGVEQMTITGATPRAPLTIAHAGSLERIITLYTDDLGQLVVQYVPEDFLVFDPQTQGVLPTVDGTTLRPGDYRVVSEGVPGEPFAGPVEASGVVSVLDTSDIPPTSLYENQTLPSVPSSILGGNQPGHTDEEGYGYLEVRDGTKLSVNVRLPDPTVYGPGPYPTVIQYSGYAPSKPGVPTGADAGGMLAGSFGFAYVGVNIRGSGCSGGVFDAFNAAQAADGYDVVETVARQPWVKNGKPGMMGISFSGITQLYVAATQPPSLAAITPLSVIEDPWYQQWPGGIYNAGFTQQWLAQRDDESAGGAKWVKDRITGGDTTCKDNLDIRSQAIPFEDFAKSLVRRPADADRRNLSNQVRDITVPTYLTGGWQDEQTGSRFGLLLDDFDALPASKTKFTMYNGHHPDSISPLVMIRWFEFLSFYVDTTVPKLNPLVRAFGPATLESIFGVPGMSFEPDRFIGTDGTTPIHGTYANSLAAYEAEQPVRVLFESGASPDFPTIPLAHRQRFEMSFPSWPVPDAKATTFFFGSNGSMTDGNVTIAGTPSAAPSAGGTGSALTGVDRYTLDPTVLGDHYAGDGDHGAVNIENHWVATADGKGLAYETAPLTRDVIVAGEGYVDLWLRPTGTDVPIEVVLSEVYAQPDSTGKQEVRVQNGLLQAGYRQLDPARTNGTQIDHLYYADNYEPLVPGEWVNVKVPLYSVAHPFRAGSKMRLEINTPGADSALWDFESDTFGTTTTDIAWGGQMASNLVLPVLPATPGRTIPAPFAPQANHPTCDYLRGQPCRMYHDLVNETLPATIGDYVPVNPERLLDTRPGMQVGYSGAKPTAGQTIELDVTSVGATQVPDDAEAVVLNVTGVAATNDGHVTVWPCGAPQPNASNLNLRQGQTAPNLVISGIGAGGKVCLFTNAGTDLIADIDGWYPAGSSLTPVVPERMLDTRAGSQIGYAGAKPTAGQVVELDVTGTGTTMVPDDAEAVVLNVTGLNAPADGHVTVWPCGEAQPNASNLNLITTEARPNLVITKVGADGKVCLYTHQGADLIADITAWYPAGSPYTPVVPERFLDTRFGMQIGYAGAKPGKGQTVEIDVTGVGTTMVPDDAQAVVLNVTGVSATKTGHVTVYPCGSQQPNASNLNLDQGGTRPNLVITGIGVGGKVCLYTHEGADLIADVVGWYPAPVAP
ncbi:MAG: CocE/NonD family hydrolase [Acidimicrobiales bacterium]|nr:CocE/NonD family hydrolase [Acidimicrobiales bacterium]